MSRESFVIASTRLLSQLTIYLEKTFIGTTPDLVIRTLRSLTRLDNNVALDEHNKSR
jgi:hypothetical protein